MSSFWETLEKLRQKPEQARRKIMWALIVAFSFILFSGWLVFANPFSIAKKEKIKEASNLLSPFSSLKRDFLQLGADFKEAIAALGVLSKSQPLPSPSLREEIPPRAFPLTR